MEPQVTLICMLEEENWYLDPLSKELLQCFIKNPGVQNFWHRDILFGHSTVF